jgi:hypothetical protein
MFLSAVNTFEMNEINFVINLTTWGGCSSPHPGPLPKEGEKTKSDHTDPSPLGERVR